MIAMINMITMKRLVIIIGVLVCMVIVLISLKSGIIVGR